MQATLDKFGRIVLPKRVRQGLGIEAGSVLEIEEQPGGVVLRVRDEEPDLVRVDGVLVYTGEASADLELAVETLRRARSRDVAAWKAR